MTDETTTMTYDEVCEVLDRASFGDILTVVRTNGGDLTSTVSGPVICAPDISKAVGIDLLDGDPHIVREHEGDIYGAFLRVELTKGVPRWTPTQ